MPGKVREVLHGKLSRLGPEAFELVTAAAVLGQRFAFEHARRVADLYEREGLSALDEALGARLVEEVRDEANHPQTSDPTPLPTTSAAPWNLRRPLQSPWEGLIYAVSSVFDKIAFLPSISLLHSGWRAVALN